MYTADRTDDNVCEKSLLLYPKNVDFRSATYFYINSANPAAVVWNNVSFFINSPGLPLLKKIAADKHVFAKLPLVILFISNLTRLTAVVCMNVRFEAKVTRGFSLSILVAFATRCRRFAVCS